MSREKLIDRPAATPDHHNEALGRFISSSPRRRTISGVKSSANVPARTPFLHRCISGRTPRDALPGSGRDDTAQLAAVFATLPKMEKAAQSPELKKAFAKHKTETEGHVARLEKVFAAIDEKPQAKKCDAIVGITDEGAEIMKEYKGSPALDEGLLAAAQAVEHYEISRYVLGGRTRSP